jgi:hypothetical protein
MLLRSQVYIEVNGRQFCQYLPSIIWWRNLLFDLTRHCRPGESITGHTSFEVDLSNMGCRLYSGSWNFDCRIQPSRRNICEITAK